LLFVPAMAGWLGGRDARTKGRKRGREHDLEIWWKKLILFRDARMSRGRERLGREKKGITRVTGFRSVPELLDVWY
jgi:hypothetical protein